MLVMDAIAQILRREGISTLFCFPTTPIIEAAVAAGLRPIICRQERVGVDMASGFARTANGRPPAVFAMQYGPGAENPFAGIATAYSDSSPVLSRVFSVVVSGWGDPRRGQRIGAPVSHDRPGERRCHHAEGHCHDLTRRRQRIGRDPVDKPAQRLPHRWGVQDANN